MRNHFRTVLRLVAAGAILSNAAIAQGVVPSGAPPSSPEMAALNSALIKLLVNQEPGLQSIFAAHPGYQPLMATGGFPGAPAGRGGVAAVAAPADQPVSRTDQNSLTAHAQLLEKAKKGGIDVYFEGDSITRRWGATDYPDFLANWKQNFFGWNAADFGWGADTIQNILWRLTNGELDGVNPKVIVLLAGTNNVGGTYPAGGDDAKVADISKGLKAILDLMRTKAPKAVIIVTGITPRNDGGGTAVMGTINKINANLAAMADGRSIRYLNINNKLADQDGRLFDGMMNASDHLHPTLKGYQVWADALNPVFTELLGPPAKEDHAPPATGDPSAKPPVSAPAAAAR